MKRNLRYSLRAVSALTLVVADLLAYITKLYSNIKDANGAIENAGGTFGDSLDGPEWLRELVGDDKFFIIRVEYRSEQILAA